METPPTLIFHGDSDTTISPEMVILFNSKMKKFNNFFQIVLYEGATAFLTMEEIVTVRL